jgi:hypothetical protein
VHFIKTGSAAPKFGERSSEFEGVAADTPVHWLLTHSHFERVALGCSRPSPWLGTLIAWKPDIPSFPVVWYSDAWIAPYCQISESQGFWILEALILNTLGLELDNLDFLGPRSVINLVSWSRIPWMLVLCSTITWIALELVGLADW